MDQQLMRSYHILQSYAERQELEERQLPNTPASSYEEGGMNEAVWHDTAGQPSFVFTGEGRRRRQWFSTPPENVSLPLLH
jgi:hypothetical protein